jgi:hypothetical protein
VNYFTIDFVKYLTKSLCAGIHKDFDPGLDPGLDPGADPGVDPDLRLRLDFDFDLTSIST